MSSKIFKNLSTGIVFLTTVLSFGCASIAPTRTARTAWAKEFEVLTSVVETLKGTIIDNDMLVFKKTDGFGTIDSVLISKEYAPAEFFTDSAANGYKYDYFCKFKIFHEGKDWLFIDTMLLKTDAGVITLEDDTPKRDVRRIADDTYVEEQVEFFITDVDSLLTTKTLSIQHKGIGIVHFTDEEIEKIQSFLNQDVITIPSKNW